MTDSSCDSTGQVAAAGVPGRGWGVGCGQQKNGEGVFFQTMNESCFFDLEAEYWGLKVMSFMWKLFGVSRKDSIHPVSYRGSSRRAPSESPT